jgi:hypothetical protein
MQTQATICLLEEATEQLGDQFRHFAIVTREVETFETEKEAEKRERDSKKKEAKKIEREAKKREKEATKRDKAARARRKGQTKEPLAASTSNPSGSAAADGSGAPVVVQNESSPVTPEGLGSPSGAEKKPKRRQVHLNISTIKFHMLGHYTPDIKTFGPTDLYSTEWVSAGLPLFVPKR